MMVEVPAETPVTRPVPDTVATVVLLLLHVPPATASVRDMVIPVHRAAGPVTGADGLTVIVLLAVQLPPRE